MASGRKYYFRTINHFVFHIVRFITDWSICYHYLISFLCFRCAITTLVDSAAINVEETISVIVSKPPSEVRLEVDGIPTSNMVVNFRDSKSRQVLVWFGIIVGKLNFKSISFIGLSTKLQLNKTEIHSPKLLSLTLLPLLVKPFLWFKTLVQCRNISKV